MMEVSFQIGKKKDLKKLLEKFLLEKTKRVMVIMFYMVLPV